MKVEGGDNKLLLDILNQQFIMIGEKMRFEDLPEDGVIEINKKKVNWYDHYKWESMEQYKAWRAWAEEKVQYLGQSSAMYIMDYADLRYGLNIRFKKEGTLF